MDPYREAVLLLANIGVGRDMFPGHPMTEGLARALAEEYRRRDATRGYVTDETVEDYLASMVEDGLRLKGGPS